MYLFSEYYLRPYPRSSSETQYWNMHADSVRLLGIEFSSSSAPKRNELAATNEMIRRLPFMINGPAPMPTRMATLIWQCKIAPKLLYGYEVFPSRPKGQSLNSYR
jgi:hypothetical protein